MQIKKFLIIIGKSTDISSEKFLCVLIRYFDDTRKDIVDRFFDLIPVTETTAQVLYNSIMFPNVRI